MKDKELSTKATPFFKQKEFWIEFLKASIIVLIVASTVGITWGIPQLASFGQSNFPSLPIDDKIPLVTEFVWVYYLTFPLGITTIYVMYFKNREVMWDIVIAIIIAFYVSMVFYFVYPTEMVKPSLDPVTLSDKFTIATWNACRPVCCLPSQHCFMALSCIFASIYEKKTHPAFRIFTAVCGILIIMSTVLLKQHYILDFIISFVILVPIFIILRTTKAGKSVEAFYRAKFEKNKIFK